jgi:ribosomal protein L12E/L44/L45/RPP1/RPP2
MADSERAEAPKSLQEAKMQYLWAPLVTALAGLVTAIVLHFVTDGKLGDASTNFNKMTDSLQSLTVEAQVNRDELDRLRDLVDNMIDEMMAGRGQPVASAAPAPSPGPAPGPAPAARPSAAAKRPMAETAPPPAMNDALARLQSMKAQIAASRLKSRAVQSRPIPHGLFEKP